MASISSSTSLSSLTSLSAKTGIGGLVSGMDIDELVTNLTATSRAKILKQQQNIQKLQWKQVAYRSVATALKEFQSKYLDVLSKTNLRSSGSFSTVKAASSSDAVTVTATGNSAAGNITIDSITQLATYETVKSASAVSKPLTGANTVTSFIEGLTAGESISISLDGKVRVITFDSEFLEDLTPANFGDRLQTLIDDAFGATGPSDRVITVGVDGDDLLTFSASGSKITLYSVGTSGTTLEDLGFTDGQSNMINTSSAIGSLTLAAGLDVRETYSFTINGKDFTVNSTDSLTSVISKINSSQEAGVTIFYSSVTDKFTITADESGSGDNVVLSDTGGNFLTALGLTGAAGAQVTKGVNAVLSVNGQPIVRSSNSFVIDGVKVDLNRTTSEAVTLTMKEDASGLTDTIKGFIEDYNSMVDLINGLVKEKVYRDFAPLSDEQKNEMSEAQIKEWETKAKSGILKSDSILSGISSKMHALMTGFSVNGVSLYSMGITSAGYAENGKLKIDDSTIDAIKTALETKGAEIKELFTSENGLTNQLNSIINDAIKTSGVQGSRGTLVEAAGVLSTRSDTENYITEAIERANKSIATLTTRLMSEETRLWNRFTAMETALQQLNTQSAMLLQFSGNGSQ